MILLEGISFNRMAGCTLIVEGHVQSRSRFNNSADSVRTPMKS